MKSTNSALIQTFTDAESTIGNVNMKVPGEISIQKERTLQIVVSVTKA